MSGVKHVQIYLKGGSVVEMDLEPASYEALVNDFVGFVSNEEVDVQGVRFYGARAGAAFTAFIELSTVAVITVEGEVQ